ncbi:MAG TPA: hypothetical protein VGU46_05370 [Acidobacteriaceae bacterium]|nr:hypothetical protein [Acidobacteriaceae bacterium]
MRLGVELLLLCGGIALAQSVLPANAPTSLPGQSRGAAGASGATSGDGGAVSSGAASTAPVRATHDPVVNLVGGKVEVVADGSSLNQTVREIARVTGMKISGGVVDEPVYGRYGPAPASEILATLLDGTGTNMLLREATATRPGELTLTQRTGGVTPPDPNAPAISAGYPEPNVPGARNYQRPREPWMNTTARDIANGVTPAQPQTGNGAAQGGNAGRPNPQQIYQQLQRMQQTQPPAQPQQQQ